MVRVLLLILMLAGCSGSERIATPFGQDTPLPEGAPGDVRMDAALLQTLRDQISADDHRLHGILVVRHGTLVFEEYYNGYGRDTPHDLRSATKSITALLTGIAIDQGHIDGVSSPIMDHLRRLALRVPLVGQLGAVRVEKR